MVDCFFFPDPIIQANQQNITQLAAKLPPSEPASIP